MFPETKSRENKTNWFPAGPDIKVFCYISRLSLQQQQKITGANQNGQLGTYNNTNLILKTTEWMICKLVLSLYYLHHFPPLATSGIIFKSLLFGLGLCVCVVVFIHKKENWQCFSRLLSRHFPPCFDHVL